MASVTVHQDDGRVYVKTLTLDTGETFFVLHAGVDVSLILAGRDGAAAENARTIAAALNAAASVLENTIANQIEAASESVVAEALS